MTTFVWNCWGIGHPLTVRILRDFILSNRPGLVFLSEVKCHQVDKVQKIASSGYPNLEFVSARGIFGGLLLMWQNIIELTVVMSNEYAINCLIHDTPLETT